MFGNKLENKDILRKNCNVHADYTEINTVDRGNAIYYGEVYQCVTLINARALVSKPNVVWREQSGPSGTISFSRSKQYRR